MIMKGTCNKRIKDYNNTNSSNCRFQDRMIVVRQGNKILTTSPANNIKPALQNMITPKLKTKRF